MPKRQSAANSPGRTRSTKKADSALATPVGSSRSKPPKSDVVWESEKQRECPAVCRRLVVVLGDQLDRTSSVFDDIDPATDIVWMAEVLEESQVVPSHKVRTAMFLSAMRHFALELRRDGLYCDYTCLGGSSDLPERALGTASLGSENSLAGQLQRAILRHRPVEVWMVPAGEYRVQTSIEQAVQGFEISLRRCPDRHFYCDPESFVEFAKGRKELRLEYFYRWMRREHSVLMDGERPLGGEWNYDNDNRSSFSKQGPPARPIAADFPPDDLTRQVFADIEQYLGDQPGRLERFDWPVTRDDALRALEDFIAHRLPLFGQYQDAMWQDEPFLYHSRLSAALNLKLLNPREVVAAACNALAEDRAPLNAVEGFVRQILGWREYVRGVYHAYMPEYVDRNELNASQPLPEFYWTGDTPMNCLSSTIRQTWEYGYAHHIQRLMVTGLYSLLLGVRPQEIHRWYLAAYLDAVEWVELPNTLGMSQYADGGIMASKPYVATGKYIQRMSNYCSGCRFAPDQKTGASACPFTTLYWDFLDRHRERLQRNRRMSLQVRNLDRLSESELNSIREAAEAIRRNDGQPPN